MDKIISRFSDSNLFSKKNIISFLVIGILMLAIPVGVQLVQKQQALKSKAAGDPINLVGPNVKCSQGTNECVVTDKSFEVELRSPYGPPLAATPTP